MRPRKPRPRFRQAARGQGPEITVLTIDIQARHRACGHIITLHGDDWGDVYGACARCNREWWIEFKPREADWRA
jgi:hypothetical protein